MRLYDCFWAKSGDPPHSLVGHMLDTAAVALEVLEREPVTTRSQLARGLGCGEEAAVRFLAAMAGSHDLGKATPAFQAKWEYGRERVRRAGFQYPPADRDVPHGALTEALVGRWLKAHGMPGRTRQAVARAIAAHHGFVAERDAVGWADDPWVTGDDLWETARDDLLRDLVNTVGAQLPAVDDLRSEVTLALMALTSVSDWIASSRDHFPYERSIASAEAYLDAARRLAQGALDAIGWSRREPLSDGPVDFESLFGFPPNDLQRAVAAELDGSRAPVLLVVEAPTGSGKTEAALYAHLALQRTARHRGLYVALPTMATGNAAFSRVRRFLSHFPNRPLDLQLQHGTALLSREYRALRVSGVGDGAEDGVHAQEWFTPKKRAMLSDYGVGTVDQALLGVLRVRHHFVRLFGLGNRTVVLDEVHAYDTYTSSLIETLVEWLGRQGASVILMSATLPRERRERLVRAFGATPTPRDEEAPYPRLTVATRAGESRSVPVPTPAGRAVTVRAVPQDTDTLAREAKLLAETGGCVACVVNTVDRAQRMYRLLASGDPIVDQGVITGRRDGDMEVYLFHARYPSEDRRVREETCLRLFGREGYERGGRPTRAILIATQVVEQSLDLDFDAMVSDLAPVDLLLQRAGRLHRFDEERLEGWGRTRPSEHRIPRLLVAGLGQSPPDLTEWQAVYQAYLLLRTWCALKDMAVIQVPGDVEPMIELVYGDADLGVTGDLADRLDRARRKYVREVEGQEAWARGAAVRDGRDLLGVRENRVSILRLEDEEDPRLQIPLTRYGEPSVGVVPLFRRQGRLFLDAEGTDELDLSAAPDDGLAQRIFARSVHLTGWTFYKSLREHEPPRPWRDHPLLRGLRPLVLEGRVARIGSVQVELDPELGVIYLHPGSTQVTAPDSVARNEAFRTP